MAILDSVSITVNSKQLHGRMPTLYPTLMMHWNLLAFRRYFCTFDLASGYYQLPMYQSDAHKTAFVTHAGLYEWLVLPMGLSNSPATFQRCMAQVFRGLVPNTCLVYLDDIITFGKSFSETMNNLQLVFDRLEQSNLTLKPKKCRMFQTEVRYLGHIVSHDGIATDPAKIDDCTELETTYGSYMV